MLHSLSMPEKLYTTAYNTSSSFSYREDSTQIHCSPLSQDDQLKNTKKKTRNRSSNKLLTEDLVTKIKGYLQKKVLYQVISQETGVSLYYIRKISNGEDVLRSVEDNRNRLRALRKQNLSSSSAQIILSKVPSLALSYDNDNDDNL